MPKLALALFVVLAVSDFSFAQGVPTNSLPNPYRSIENWGQLPDGRSLGIDQRGRDRSRRHQRLGRRALRRIRPPSQIESGRSRSPATARTLDPILKFDASGKLVKSFGAGLMLFPHGIHVDRDGNVWVTDGVGRGGKGHQVFKFSPDGKLLLTLGKAGVAGQRTGRVQCAERRGRRAERRHLRRRRPWRQHQRAHREVRQGRQVHQDVGQEGHGAGRVRHAARARDGFARPAVRRRPRQQPHPDLRSGRQVPRRSGSSSAGRAASTSTENDILYVADSESESVSQATTTAGSAASAIGSAKDGKVTAFIPDPVEKTTGTSAAEGVAADAAGNIYGAEVGPKRLMKYVRK